MSEMISVASGFQYSVNIGYDLNTDEKLKNFIPTKASLSLLEDILLSTNPNSTNRARVLVGAYGKGKSHIVLSILSILMKRDLNLFEKALPKIMDDPRLNQCVENYYESANKILPVIITGSNTSLTQAFLLALQRTLSDNDLLDIMPETNYKAAVSVIERWRTEFPDTFNKFSAAIDEPVSVFTGKLVNYDASAYEKFEKIYPLLTAGSVFNPFLGFDVVELYENAAKGLQKRGYSGLYVVYDEFSKYLEANITDASISDTKMLQDFAEKCNRSGHLQMHLMLISHKEISNYIDKLPQQKVDGWRGVSERFTHVHLNNNFSQTYEIISTVIKKKEPEWDDFCSKHKTDFDNIYLRYQKHPIFSDSLDELNLALYGCYPLQPVSTFILPRLSERVAQNERTLFTFLSADGTSTLPSFLRLQSNKVLSFITPDIIYDYFEPLFKKEAYASEIHNYYVLTSTILNQLVADSLESKIVKTLSLIYILGQFERLKPTKEEIVGIYSATNEVSEIEMAINNLIEREFVVYLKRSNDYLRLKKTSGVDVKQKIADLVETQTGKISLKDTLNKSNFDNYMYPSRYNDEREMTRYFSFEFIDSKEIKDDIDWDIKSEHIEADGIIYGIVLNSEDNVDALIECIQRTSANSDRLIFVVPKHYRDIEKVIQEYNAVSVLRDQSADDPILFEEYEVIFEDLNEIIRAFIGTYTHPEEYKSYYIQKGEKKTITRKAALTELMSSICENVYSLTPVVNNEAVNRNEITNVSTNSRSKIIAALLRAELEHNLGLSGTAQEVSIMRSTLIRTGIWSEESGIPVLNLRPADKYISNMLATIEEFITIAKQAGKVNFNDLYRRLTYPEYHIGLRRGLIPIYLAAVIHEYKQQIVITDKFGPVPTNSDTLLQINSAPYAFQLSYIDWSEDKQLYIQSLSSIFSNFVVEAEKSTSSYDYVANAIRRWFMALPKFSKESIKKPDGSPITKRDANVIKAIKSNVSGFELLFTKFPEAFNYQDCNEDLAEEIRGTKECYEQLLGQLKETLISDVKSTFILKKDAKLAERMSLSSVIKDWCDTLDTSVFEELFTDGTQKCLELFRSITNDEIAFITRLAKLATDLRIEDWDSNTFELFKKHVLAYKETAEQFHCRHIEESLSETCNYQLTFSDESGVSTTKRFEKTEISKRGKLLYNQISAALDSMGQSISEQEKRQILMEILKRMC